MLFKIEVFETGETVAIDLTIEALCKIPGFEFADESIEDYELEVGQGYCTPFLTGQKMAHVIRTK